MGQDYLGHIFAKGLQTLCSSSIGHVPAFRTDPPFEHFRIWSVLQHFRAVVAFEHDRVTLPEQVEHIRSHQTGIRTIPKDQPVFPYDEPAGLCCIMGCGKWFNQKIPDSKPLVVPACMMVNMFIGSPAVVEKIMERPCRCVDGDIKAPGEYIKPPDMVTMFMGDKHRLDQTCIEGRCVHSQERLFCAQTGIQEKCPALSLQKNTVAFASAGQYSAAHRPIIGRSCIRVFDFLVFLPL